ncbi:MAG: class I SAM-dependent methyltransferase [Pseudomonadota bacterium]
MKCRHCKAPLELTFLDLGHAPPSNAYLSPEQLQAPEVTYPLRIKTCTNCWLVQTEDYTAAEELFSPEYAYFSSTSKGWLAHAEAYAAMITVRLGLTADSHVIEVASNDGYLLKNFVAKGIPCLGIESTDSTADASDALGIPTLREFFGEALAHRLAEKGKAADLIVGNNVYAHVPDINDFTMGLAAALKPDGVISLEFPHLLNLISDSQFDTVYHEHFSYLSLSAVTRIFAAAGLRVFDVEHLPTHVGSLRIYGCREGASHSPTPAVAETFDAERKAGLETETPYRAFQQCADTVKDGLLRFLLDAKARGKSVAGYGAAAKGNTLLNYAGVKPDLLPMVADAAPAKQGQLLPGSHIPIVTPKALIEARPNYVLILPWNIAAEVMAQLSPLRAQGTQFVTAIPDLRVQ